MQPPDIRIERDSFGELEVPAKALYGAQTERAIRNFPLSGLRMPRPFIRALGLIKAAAAKANQDLGLLKVLIAEGIIEAAESVAAGHYDDEFPIDVFQTGSGTSSNMNANEVIAHLASAKIHHIVHPNDEVNMCQSSNDVIPTAIHVSASLEIHQSLLPALEHLATIIETRARELDQFVKTGRTHLMDAMPLTFGQELSGWASQIRHNQARIQSTLVRLHALAIGGTAVGTGINAHPEFGARVAKVLSQKTGLPFKIQSNYFEGLSCQDTIVELSGQIRVLAVSVLKIVNDLRLMNSGPLAGLAEIVLTHVQPGSSIMPGKVNPVIPEAVAMCAAQVIGNDATIAFAGQSGQFQLNTMLPLIAYNILQSIQLMSNGSRLLADKVIQDFKVNEANILAKLGHNPILVTALNPIIGYEKGANIAKRAYQEGRTILEVAKEMTDLDPRELEALLDPKLLTQGGIKVSK